MALRKMRGVLECLVVRREGGGGRDCSDGRWSKQEGTEVFI